MPKIFIIHGRDKRAVAGLQSYLESLKLSVLTVGDLDAAQRGPATIYEIIERGINTADVILGLLTPDESVALFDPDTDRLEQDQIGWQARANVFFELGVAFAKSKEKTIIATLGNHRPFSDIFGVYHMRLDDPDAKKQLANKISTLLGENPTQAPDSIAGSFQDLARIRWKYFDELVILERRMKDTVCGNATIRLWDVVKKTVAANPKENWKAKGKFETTAARFMNAVRVEFPRAKGVVSDTFWWLVVLGFFEYDGIDDWWEKGKEVWDSSCDYAHIAERGRKLISKLKRSPRLLKVAAVSAGK